MSDCLDSFLEQISVTTICNRNLEGHRSQGTPGTALSRLQPRFRSNPVSPTPGHCPLGRPTCLSQVVVTAFCNRSLYLLSVTAYCSGPLSQRHGCGGFPTSTTRYRPSSHLTTAVSG
ncbi:uncharacterized protein OE_5107R (plasmid) [Halobacterium salinarum R1]|uniref:Uncharacterized protein n=3 Tax=Halobacterium salinarum TaxID=2242 RepID=A0A510NAX0_HALSA|nr:uncharacterized protein HBSAL_12150 [Halobacterium salinarum]CAP15489.1 uncharacterized protein OE_5107R [Halobacterium salinarum R1]DAC79847.1 TPA_inf: uncharacterized protein VNG_6224H [Halobacterium salinarum NRC-1]